VVSADRWLVNIGIVLIFFSIAFGSGCIATDEPGTTGDGELIVSVVADTPEEATVLNYNNTSLINHEDIHPTVEKTVSESSTLTPKNDSVIISQNVTIIDDHKVSSVREDVDSLPKYYEGDKYPDGVYLEYENRNIVIQFLDYD
jgi:hypothetical protein